MEEIWKDIEGYEGLYQVSNYGRIKSLNYNHTKQEKIITPVSNHRGYLKVTLSKNNVRKNKNIHKLVAIAFILNPNNYNIVNHIDGNKLNNKANNLEWCTAKENTAHAFKHNLMKPRGKPVLQYDKNDNFIKEYRSIAEACREVNTSSMNIIKCCKKINKTAKGFYWEYKNKEE